MTSARLDFSSDFKTLEKKDKRSVEGGSFVPAQRCAGFCAGPGSARVRAVGELGSGVSRKESG